MIELIKFQIYDNRELVLLYDVICNSEYSSKKEIKAYLSGVKWIYENKHNYKNIRVLATYKEL